MYTRTDFRSVEPVCYEKEHIEKVLHVLDKNLPGYFDRFIQTSNGSVVTSDGFKLLQEKFGVEKVKKTKEKDLSGNFKDVIIESINDFEKDREDYQKIFDSELLEEYEDDTYTFKSEVLRNQCPIIRKTLMSKNAKELDKYRKDFKVSDAAYLLKVVQNLCKEADNYMENVYDSDSYDDTSCMEDFQMAVFDSDDCTAYGVIGGGIKSLMLHKIYPAVFSNRSRMALWALWYLTDKKDFGCETDSEFLMIDVSKMITQQNYFYPYELFNYYAFYIYLFLKQKAEELNAEIDPEYRYVIVDAFLNYVAYEHENEISFLQSQVRDGSGATYA